MAYVPQSWSQNTSGLSKNHGADPAIIMHLVKCWLKPASWSASGSMYGLYNPGNAHWNMPLWGFSMPWWVDIVHFLPLLTRIIASTASVGKSPDTITQDINTTMEDLVPDKDTKKEIVDNPNILAEVKLPAHVCKFNLLSCSSITQSFTQIEGVLYLRLQICFSNQHFQP